MAAGGQILAADHQAVRAAVKPGVSTMDLDQIAEDFIRSHDGATPGFKGLYGFPASICSSINEEIVHGIPSTKRVLKEGDVISVDIGVFYKGCFTGFRERRGRSARSMREARSCSRDEGRARSRDSRRRSSAIMLAISAMRSRRWC